MFQLVWKGQQLRIGQPVSCLLGPTGTFQERGQALGPVQSVACPVGKDQLSLRGSKDSWLGPNAFAREKLDSGMVMSPLPLEGFEGFGHLDNRLQELWGAQHLHSFRVFPA